MKKYSVIFLGFTILFDIIGCSTDVYRVYLQQEIPLVNAKGEYFFGIPCFSNDKLYLQIKVPKSYYLSSFAIDFVVMIRGFNLIPTDEEITNTEAGYTILANPISPSHSDEYFNYYQYPFETTNTAYLSFYLSTQVYQDIYVFISSEKAQLENRYKRVKLLEELEIPVLYGFYYLIIDCLGEDNMAFEIKVLRPPYPNYYIDFKVFVAAISSTQEPNEDQIYGSKYTLLKDYEESQSGNYDIYSYPFTTSEGTNYLSFYLDSKSLLNVKIYIKSEKAETAVLIIVIIVVAVFLLIGGIVAFLKFCGEKLGLPCFNHVKSSDI